MNSERPPESASSTPTGPRGSEGLREGLGYFLFESRRPFEHVTCVPRARPQQGQHASPAGRSHRRPRRRQGGKGWQGRRQGRWQGLWPCGAPDPLCAAALNARYSVEPAERRRQSCGRRRPSPRPRRRPVDKHTRTAIEKKEKDGGASGARGRSGRGSGRGRARAGTPPAEATMPLAALQAARGAPLAGLPHAPEGREGREAGSVTRGHGRCGPRRARARGSP